MENEYYNSHHLAMSSREKKELFLSDDILTEKHMSHNFFTVCQNKREYYSYCQKARRQHLKK